MEPERNETSLANDDPQSRDLAFSVLLSDVSSSDTHVPPSRGNKHKSLDFARDDSSPCSPVRPIELLPSSTEIVRTSLRKVGSDSISQNPHPSKVRLDGPPKSWLRAASVTRLKQGDLAHVDSNEQRLFHQLVIAFIGVHATLGGHDDAVYVAVVRRIIEAGGAAKNVHRVVVPAK